MRCEEVRELLSAMVDGEASLHEGAVADAHVATCSDCRAWQERAHRLQRWSRIRSLASDATPDPLWQRALLHAEHARVRPGPGVRRAAMLVAGVALLALTLPLIVTGHVDGVRDAAGFEAILGLAFVAVVVQPWRAPGVAAIAAPAGALLAVLEVFALVAGDGSVVDLLRHVAALIGGIVAWRTSRGLPFGEGGDGLRRATRTVATRTVSRVPAAVRGSASRR